MSKAIPSKKDLEDAYRKSYQMQAVGTNPEQTIRTSIPRQLVKREARRLGIDVDKFLEDYQVVWVYNGFPGAWTTFEPKRKSDKIDSEKSE